MRPQRAERFCGGRKSPLHTLFGFKICVINLYAVTFDKTGLPFLWNRNCVAHLQVRWDSLYGYRTVLLPSSCFFDGRTVFAPTDLLPWGSCFSRFYSIFKLRTRCRKCFSVRSETSPRPHLFTLTECFLIHCYLAGYSIWDNILGVWLRYGTVIHLYLSRKRGGLLHKKCNN